MSSQTLQKVFFFLFFLCVSPSGFAQPHLDFQGDFNFALYLPPPSKAIVLTQDKSIGIALTSVSSPQIGARITSFNVGSLSQIDTKFVGFGPEYVELRQLSDGYRVVVLTSRGGPQTVTIYDMSAGGLLTFRAETRLTTSGNAGQSNPVLSARGRAGFVRIWNSLNVSELVSFSLDNGAVLAHLSVPEWEVLNIYDNGQRSLIVGGRGQQLTFIDSTDPTNISVLGQATLPAIGTNTFYPLFSAFSSDGTVVFAGGSNAKLSAVDTTTRQVLGSISQGFSTSNLALIETGQMRLIAQYGGNDTFQGLILVNATEPASLNIMNQVDLRQEFVTHRYLTFGREAKTIVLASDRGVTTFRVPSLKRLVDTALMPVTQFGFTVNTLGDPERIIGAWGSDNNFSARVYSLPNKVNSVVNFDLDGKTDVGVFTPSSATWRWLRSTDGMPSDPVQFGQSGDRPVPADYDGDTITDLAIYRPTFGLWQVLQSGGGTVSKNLGIGSDKPRPADFDGDGKADIAVFRNNPNHLLIAQSTDGHLVTKRTSFGKISTLAGDYDGDGRDDLVTFQRGIWTIYLSSGATQTVTFGQSGDLPFMADFDNDGKSDIGYFRPSTHTWRIQESYAGLVEIQFGQDSDLPVPADYDGDGRADISLFQPSTATWQIIQSTGIGIRTVQFGSPGDIPLTAQ